MNAAVIDNPTCGRFVVTEEPVRVRFESEPFVLAHARGYIPTIYVITTKTKQRGYMLLSAASLSDQLEPIRRRNEGSLLGVEVWVRKASADRMAKYIVEE